MKDLINNGLVRNINPLEHLYNIEKFASTFIDYVDIVYKCEFENYRITNRTKDNGIKIHLEKMNTIGYQLMDRGLAVEDGMWYTVHPKIANDFMFYLAHLIGEKTESQPVTDRVTNFNIASPLGNEEQINKLGIENIRTVILEGAFPIPKYIEKAKDIQKFKDKHGTQLKSFRNYIEGKIDIISNSPIESRNNLLEALKAEIDLEKQSIESNMKKKWEVVDRGSLYNYIFDAATFGVGIKSGGIAEMVISGAPLVKRISDKSKEIKKNNLQQLSKQQAYAFLVERKFSSK